MTVSQSRTYSRLIARLALAGLVALVPLSGIAQGRSGKLDAVLSQTMQNGAAAQRRDATVLSRRAAGGEFLIEATMRFHGNGLVEARALGVEVHSVLGNIATVSIPVSKIGALADLESVEYLEAEHRVVPRLDKSVPITRADRLRTGVAPNFTGGLTGKGVIVGIIDDGLDFRHRDFRNADGSTRLLAIWDRRRTGASGAPPAGLTYGGECTTAMIDAAIQGDATACAQSSSGGHGTHVGGIAAGNGQATGNGQAAYRFVGMAPEADILSSSGGGGSSGILDAIAWMKAKAQAAGKPLVINMSFGSYFGARDGTSNYEQGMSNAGDAGVILVAAAGNEGDAPLRAAGTIREGETVTIGLRVPASKSDGRVEMWYPGTNRYGVSAQGPGCAATAVVNAEETREFQTGCGLIAITSTAVLAANDDRQIMIEFSGGASPLVSGEWTLRFTGTAVAGGAAPFSLISGEDASDFTFTTNTTPVTAGILTDTSTATRVIAVGATNSNYSWNSLNGPFTDTDTSGPIGDIATFSSRGPRRACSNRAKCPEVMKPEIAAPGSKILAAYAVDTAKAADNSQREADGVHFASTGTSMASPHVAGAVALLLQKQASLTPEQVKPLLFANVQTSAFTAGLPVYSEATPNTPANPNHAFGYGPVDIAKAAGALSGTPAGSINYEGLWWNAPAGSESGWGINFAHQGDIIFATWFTYDLNGRAWWLTMTANKTADSVYSGTLSQTRGPVFSAVPFSPAAVTIAAVGSGTLTFTDANSGRFAYTVNGIAQTKSITRQIFAAPPTCTSSAQPNLAAATNFQDLWWAAPGGVESGWGVNFTHQSDTIFATWFTYDTDGAPLWLSATTPKTGAGVYAGTLNRTTGPAFNAVPFDPAKIGLMPVGTLTITFADGNNASFAYTATLGGPGTSVTQSKSITRQLFAPPAGTVCQ